MVVRQLAPSAALAACVVIARRRSTLRRSRRSPTSAPIKSSRKATSPTRSARSSRSSAAMSSPRSSRSIATAPCPARVWTSAASIPALDGDGRWIVATRFDDTLWRVRLDGELEPIGSRFGLTARITSARSPAPARPSRVLLDSRACSSTERRRPRHALRPRGAARIARGRAGSRRARERSRDRGLGPRGERSAAFAVDERAPGVPRRRSQDRRGSSSPRRTACGSSTPTSSSRSTSRTSPPPRSPARGCGSRSASASTSSATRRALDTTVASAGDEPMFGAPNGDVWVGANGLRRYALGGGARRSDVARTGRSPIFERVCAHCHLPGGDAGVDLSTAASWTAEHDELVRRVVITRTMPPAGTDLDDADRATLCGVARREAVISHQRWPRKRRRARAMQH